MVTGSCLCGHVRYHYDGKIEFARNCHCSLCRKHTGAAFATFGYAETRLFRWVAGAGQVKGYRSSPSVTRTFCGECGSTLQFLFEGQPEAFGLALCTVDGDPGCRPASHVCVASKAPWFEISDDLPRHEGTAPEA